MRDGSHFKARPVPYKVNFYIKKKIFLHFLIKIEEYRHMVSTLGG